jgi:hypothetical protein
MGGHQQVEFIEIDGRKGDLLLVSKPDDRFRASWSVEMTVNFSFGKLPNDVQSQSGCHGNGT